MVSEHYLCFYFHLSVAQELFSGYEALSERWISIKIDMWKYASDMYAEIQQMRFEMIREWESNRSNDKRDRMKNYKNNIGWRRKMASKDMFALIG